jgi:hypothetical protein
VGRILVVVGLVVLASALAAAQLAGGWSVEKGGCGMAIEELYSCLMMTW